jgi:hypothetical protein
VSRPTPQKSLALQALQDLSAGNRRANIANTGNLRVPADPKTVQLLMKPHGMVIKNVGDLMHIHQTFADAGAKVRLGAAVQGEDLDEVKRQLDQGTHPNAAMHEATQTTYQYESENHPYPIRRPLDANILKLLLQRGGDPNHKEGLLTVADQAYINQNAPALRILQEHPAFDPEKIYDPHLKVLLTVHPSPEARESTVANNDVTKTRQPSFVDPESVDPFTAVGSVSSDRQPEASPLHVTIDRSPPTQWLHLIASSLMSETPSEQEVTQVLSRLNKLVSDHPAAIDHTKMSDVLGELRSISFDDTYRQVVSDQTESLKKKCGNILFG